MKKVLSLLMALIMAFSAVQCLSVVSFAAYDESGIFEYGYENGTVVITDVSNTAEGTVTVPSEIAGDTVTAIGDYAFKNCDKITEIIIPSTVRVIEDHAFYGCAELVSVVLSDVQTIGYRAFENCGKLQQITIPKTVRSASAVFYNSGLETVTFEDGITGIPDKVCSGAKALKNVSIPDTVTTIGNYAFDDCSSLETIAIPEGVTSIGSYAFSDCSSLSEFAFPSSLISVDDHSFLNCSKLASVDFSNVQELGYRLFENCVKLKQVSLPNTLKAASYPFYNSGLEAVTFADGILVIPNKACADAKALKNVFIPDTVTTIGSYAFDTCSSLETIVIPEGVTSIGTYAFNNCSSLTEMAFPETLISVGDYAFQNCGELVSVDFSNVQELGYRLFENCVKLKQVSLPDTLKAASYPFYNSGLETAVFEDGIQMIPKNTFAQAKLLKSVTMPQSVTEIGSYAFKDCENMEEIVLPQGLMIIDSYAFDGCVKLKKINIPDTVIGIQSNSFNECSLLAEVTTVKNTTGWKYFENKNVSIIEIPCSHPYNEDTRQQDATCTEPGYTYGLYCPYCEIWVEGHEVIPATGHIASDPVIENEWAATCTNGGSYDSVVYCSVCQAEISRTKGYTDKLGHSFTNYIDDGNTTCTEDGTKSAKCDRCGVTDTIVNTGSAHGHVPAEAVKENEVPAICIENGWYDSVVYCSVCGDELSRQFVDTPKLGHSFTNYIADGNATCTKDGTKTAKCDRCDETDTIADAGSAHGHIAAEAVRENIVEATCTKEGTYESVVYCKACHVELSREKETIEKTAHKAVTDKAVAATCTKEGLTAGKHCSVCGAVLVEQKTVAKKSHTVKDSVTKATTGKDGKIVSACSVCKKTIRTTVIPKVSSITLSATKYTYDGNTKTPKITVKDSKGKVLVKNRDYTLKAPAARKNTGKYSVTVTLTGNYSGSKTLYFYIVPGKTSKIAVKQSTTAIKATWKAVTGASGYRVTLCDKDGYAIKNAYTANTTYTFTRLTPGGTYHIKVTAYKTIDQKKAYSTGYTMVKTATAPAAPKLQAVAGKGKASLYATDKYASGYEFYMKSGSSYKKIATQKSNYGSYEETGFYFDGASAGYVDGVFVTVDSNTESYVKTGLKKGTTYYFKVRGYKLIDGQKIYGEFSSVKSVKVK